MFTAEREHLATRIRTEAGLQVSTDPATANPPCVVVPPFTNITRSGPCAYDAEVDVYLIHAAPAGHNAVAWLERALPDLLAVLPAGVAEFTTYPHPSGPLPAYRVGISTTLRED